MMERPKTRNIVMLSYYVSTIFLNLGEGGGNLNLLQREFAPVPRQFNRACSGFCNIPTWVTDSSGFALLAQVVDYHEARSPF